MPLSGFEDRFTDFPDYILKITEEIWEGRNVGSIRKYYSDQCVVHSAMGTSIGVDRVVAGTLEKVQQFPDREILGEEIIWSGTPATGLLSSHRSIMVQTHAGPGRLGAPTGKRVAMRAIADCAAQNNQIYEEWLVVDQSAAVFQLGLEPRAVGRDWALADLEAGGAAPAMEFETFRLGPDTHMIQDDPAAEAVRALQTAIWQDKDLSVLDHGYDRAVNLHLPGGMDRYGRTELAAFHLGYLASFPDAEFGIDHSIVAREPGRPVRVATRWTLTGAHDGWGTFGAPSGAPMFVLGITHSDMIDGRITREWVVIDEIAIWNRIARSQG